MDCLVKEISSEETIDIRHRVMWPNMPVDYVRLPEDELGKHFGLFVNGELKSIVSLFVKDNKAQFRKFATNKCEQGKGYGTILLNQVMDIAAAEGVLAIWCNARLSKSSYYLKFGLKQTNTCFNKGGIQYVIMEKVLVNA